ncbi:hypothetical protein LTR72_008293 [Exophiala xenobiotica]|nr:hypothetical protein LTR72_008293 [Exophiala xenobiotica]KAK5291444.1 hypothetical protein LTR14_006018 [Exophiala xenobiotica]KAK5442893.1 hypothetical protein LTR18_005570 [Exophiala xenobiotica]KAK5556425.1 hypothetical protein LTR46_005617 [Exophiala xenobiotica]
MPTPQNVVTAHQGYPSSLSTIDSNDQSMSFDNSFEVNDTNLATILTHHAAVNPLGGMYDDEDDDPWTSGRYLSQVDDVEQVDSSNMIGAEDMEDSLYVETGGPSSSDMSMLSSQYASSFLQAPDSLTTSNLISQVGAAFANQFLQLTEPPRDETDVSPLQTLLNNNTHRFGISPDSFSLQGGRLGIWFTVFRFGTSSDAGRDHDKLYNIYPTERSDARQTFLLYI